MEDKLSNLLQENVLTLLCFDIKTALLIRNCITSNLFENHIYRKIAAKAIDYIDCYKQTPNEHLPDLLENELEEPKTAQIYTDTLYQMHQLKDTVNAKFVISQLQSFVRQQYLKLALIEAVDLVKDNKIEQAENTLNKTLKNSLDVFDPGTKFFEPQEALNFLNKNEDPFCTGIQELDKRGIGPARKELFTMLAPSNRGKTWALIHFGKKALLQRLKVLHISLEMSEERISQRYIQSFFSISKNNDKVVLPVMEKDNLGKFVSIDTYMNKNTITLKDANINNILKRKLGKVKGRFSLIIKQFPTGILTMSALQAYLNNLEQAEKFMPDMIIIDYADLMKIDGANLRIDTGRTYKELRGLAVERNIAMITASQSNREAENVKIITMKHLAEDYSKAAISDNIISYNQTSLEKKLGLARLFVAKSRNDISQQTMIITQSYETGQFCLDSSLMTNESYFSSIESRDNNYGDKE